MKRTVFIFLQMITVIFCDICPPGLLWHQETSKCCQPITHCEPGHQIEACKETHEFDYCTPCPKGQTNSYNTSSFDMKACKEDKCESDTILDQNGECMCNLLEGYVGKDSWLCINGGKFCPKGKELSLDGLCKPCPFGYYKDWEGYGFCKKQINCALLQLEYKENGNSQKAAICKKKQKSIKQRTDFRDSDDSEQGNESHTLSVRNLMVAVTEKSVQQPVTEFAFRSDYVKNTHLAKEIVFACEFKIIVAVLGTLLFLSSILIIYLIITKRSKSSKVKTSFPLKSSISEVGRCNSWNPRPLPILPRARTYSTPDDTQYIPMNASRHGSCSSTNTQENTGFYKQQNIKDDWICHNQDAYNNNISSPPSESTYVKIEPISLYRT